MLWAAPGEPCSDGGALWQPGCSSGDQSTNWPTFAALVSAGARAVRSAAPSSALIIHTDLGNRLGSDSAEYIIQWYSELVDAGAADWDAIALSFYPFWGAGNTSNVAKLAAVAAKFPGKGIILAETAYPYQASSGKSSASRVIRIKSGLVKGTSQSGSDSQFSAVSDSSMAAPEKTKSSPNWLPPYIGGLHAEPEFPYTAAGQLAYTQAIIAQVCV